MIRSARTGSTRYATPTDTEIEITRVVKASQAVAFAVYTEPRHLQRWLLGPEGWTMPVCEMDLRPGGSWRYVWRRANGTELTMGGTVKDVVPPRLLVTTERWGPEWPETINTVTFSEADGYTTIRLTITYPSKEARDSALQTGMREGMDRSFERLDQVLESVG